MTVKTDQKTVRINLLQGLVVCCSLWQAAANPNSKELSDLLSGGFASARLSRLPLYRAKRSC